jgi:predicted dehydrogenase
MSRLRIGFVGVGAMGQCAHLRNYAVLGNECEVAALAELRPELGRRVAARYGIPKSYANAAEMLAAEKLDALVASQPFTRHGVLLPELLAAGLPVFIEKPLASSVAVGRELATAVEAKGSRVMVGYHKRSDPATEWLKAELLRLQGTGEWGRMTYVRISMPAGDWVAGGFDELIRTDDPLPALATDPADAEMTADEFRDYTTFVNYYIHQVNLLRFLFGEDYEMAYAEASGVLLAARSASGVPGVIEMSPFTTKQGWQESALVAFEHGWLRLDLPAPLVRNQAGKVTAFAAQTGLSCIPQMPPEHAMLRQARNFLGFVRNERPAPCEANEALRDLEVARDFLRLRNGGMME